MDEKRKNGFTLKKYLVAKLIKHLISKGACGQLVDKVLKRYILVAILKKDRK